MNILKQLCCCSKTKTEKKTEESNTTLTNMIFSCFSMMGEGTKKFECQDSIGIVDNHSPNFYFFGVFDGHGSSGKEAANMASDFMANYIEKNHKAILRFRTDQKRMNFIKKMFKLAENQLKNSEIDMSCSGTTAIAFFIQDSICYTINLGDSRGILGRITQTQTFTIELSRDHKPLATGEKERILKAGGKIERALHNGKYKGPYRVWADEDGPGIAMARSLGDFLAKKIGLTYEPEITQISLNVWDQFLVCASDGLWDVMGSTEVVCFIQKCEDTDKVSEQQVKEARARWQDLNQCKTVQKTVEDFPGMKSGIDDISVVVAYQSYNASQIYIEDKKNQLFTNYYIKQDSSNDTGNTNNNKNNNSKIGSDKTVKFMKKTYTKYLDSDICSKNCLHEIVELGKIEMQENKTHEIPKARMSGSYYNNQFSQGYDYSSEEEKESEVSQENKIEENLGLKKSISKFAKFEVSENSDNVVIEEKVDDEEISMDCGEDEANDEEQDQKNLRKNGFSNVQNLEGGSGQVNDQEVIEKQKLYEVMGDIDEDVDENFEWKNIKGNCSEAVVLKVDNDHIEAVVEQDLLSGYGDQDVEEMLSSINLKNLRIGGGDL